MAVSYIKPVSHDSKIAAKRLQFGDSTGWAPADFKAIMSALGSELAQGVIEQIGIDDAVVAVEAEEVDDLSRDFIRHLEDSGVSCSLACFWIRRMAVRDVDRKVIHIAATSSQQYIDDSKPVRNVIILQPVASRPEFIELVINKFRHVNSLERVILISPIVHPDVLQRAFRIVAEKCQLEPDVLGFHRVIEETDLLRQTRFGSEGLLGQPRSDLKKRYFPEFAAHRMDNRPKPDPSEERGRGFTPGGSVNGDD